MAHKAGLFIIFSGKFLGKVAKWCEASHDDTVKMSEKKRQRI